MKQDELFNSEHRTQNTEPQPVTCLGIEFPSDEARRQHFTELLRDRLRNPEFRKIEGFPIGSDEDILNLSDPPYYTACPNPWMADFIAEWEAQKPEQPEGHHYHREPFAADVSEGKNDPIYRIPSYHTKVPPKAIENYILHYTEPGDIVLDAFCGTGMTGVASLLCKPAKRNAILIDLSPTATFTASIMNSPILNDLSKGQKGRLGEFVTKKLLPLYQTEWDGKKQPFDYAIWSDWGECSECAETFRLFDVVIDFQNSKMRPEYECPKCGAALRSDSQKKAFSTDFDPWLNKPVRIAKNTMVMLSKKVGNRAIRRTVTDKDKLLANEIGNRPVDQTPMELPYSHMTHERNNLPEYWGITHIHHFYTRRNYYAISRVAAIDDQVLRKAGLFAVITSLENNATRRNRFYVDSRRPNGSPVGPLSNTLYVPTVQVETNIGMKILSVLRDTSKNKSGWPRGRSLVSTQSATQLNNIPDNSVDFVFTDPPFGGNINYSEQNILAEWWLRLFTNNESEAITNSVQKKGLPEYQALMTQCFKEYYRVLKPGRWMVVEFHNSSNGIWSAIQQALEASGFVVATVAVLDKIHSTLHQDHKAAAVDKDLAITVYKPNGGLEHRFEMSAGSADGAWDFIRTHLDQLPVFMSKDGQAEVIAERQNYLLFDRMVAFHVQRGATVPLSAAEFYAGLSQRYSERDGMFFTPEQVAEYDRKRMTVREVLQLQLFVTDESSAIQWLKQQLSKRTQTFQELHPQFLKEIGGWQKHEKSLELSVLLEQNFLRYDGKSPVPEQIHAYLSTNWKELRNLPKDDPTLVAKARDRWYVPDPNKAGDLEKLREKALLKEFEEYKEVKKKLKVFRLEAVRAGFKKAWQERDYAVIVAVADKIPNNVLEEDPKLLMWYDQAVTRIGDREGYSV
ncbi:DNA methyltransferase [Nitrosococcus watsonii]|uniref:DNA methylase N-4/N-6 domain protein n=1 Tax=Nitrosococcus watsoni (strain C-113) TaxID=105559 RepID=D8K843_NITWC|nr:DNA methyltransferase [Nitrosococcus watsonii]ADJ27038.1 DNA methylase N-4/N-6 domain protein [Nitrosococcus watsonii C-113]